MLQNFVNDWMTAYKKAVILEENKDDNGTIQYQKSEMVFQGVRIEIRTTRRQKENDVDSSETPSAPEYYTEFFVPSTLVLVRECQNDRYPVSEFIATMLEAIDPNSESIAKEARLKRKDMAQQFMDNLVKEWETILSDSEYEKIDINFIIDYAKNALQNENVDWISKFVKVMVDFQKAILNDTVCITRRNGTTITEADILYDQICRSCIPRAMANDGKFITVERSINAAFKDEQGDERIPPFILDAKVVLRKIFEICNNQPFIFSTVAKGIAQFFAFKKNEDLAYHIAKVKEEQDRRFRNRFNNHETHRVSISSLMGDVASAFENAQPIRSKKKK